mmetsp:Transcript_58912/g.140607  ORF Transcript_58912/g.140607 Transcript_58912/m.140607 type:complete len:587 (+) Transcript_58912:125-1885(+)
MNHAISFSFACVATLLGRASSLGVSAHSFRRDVQRDGGATSANVLSAIGSGDDAAAPAGMSSVAQLLSTFGAQAESNLETIDQRHAAEELRLKAGMSQSDNPDVRLALEQSITGNAESLKETKHVYQDMLKFSNSMAGLLQSATPSTGNCQHMSCGAYSSCTETSAGAKCICNEGYIGVGSACSPPPEFAPQRVLLEGSGASAAVADVHVAVLDADKVGIVFRDISRSNSGHVIVGLVRNSGKVELGAPQQFTNEGAAAYDPLVAGTGAGRMAIAWRDQHRDGSGWVRGATVGGSGIRGAEMFLQWGEPVSVCRGQSHRMAIIPLPGSRCALMYNDRLQASQGEKESAFGSAALLQIGHQGAAAVQGTFRFIDSPVCRIEATKVKPNAFVLAARAEPLILDEFSQYYAVPIKQEAVAIYGELVDDDLVFDPNVLSLVPNGTQIWARGVSLIAPETVAYAYQEGSDLKIKMSVVQIDPSTHRMQVKAGPSELHTGFSPYVSTLSMPYTAGDPHSLVYFEDGNTSTSKVNVCAWSASNQVLDQCEDFVWLPHKLGSVSGVHLAGGKTLMVFTTEAQELYYTVFGLTKK